MLAIPPMTNPIIERAARALCLQAGLDPDRKFKSSDWSEDTAPHEFAWHEFQPAARAVLRAIREPTGKMCAEVSRREINLRKTENMPMSVDQIWQAMIDAALGDG